MEKRVSRPDGGRSDIVVRGRKSLIGRKDAANRCAVASSGDVGKSRPVQVPWPAIINADGGRGSWPWADRGLSQQRAADASGFSLPPGANTVRRGRAILPAPHRRSRRWKPIPPELDRQEIRRRACATMPVRRTQCQSGPAAPAPARWQAPVPYRDDCPRNFPGRPQPNNRTIATG